jgi:pyruvate,orthophosphate dikinase
MAAAQRWVYFFGDGKADGTGDQKDLLGGKGAGLAEMTRIGLPVPPGFTITTEACKYYQKHGKTWPQGLQEQVQQALRKFERRCQKKLGAPDDPLLVSVRSGAARSMPGMMETILNLGLNDQSVEGLAAASSNRRFALDAYRRLITMYGSTAKGISREHFENAFDEVKQTRTRARLRRGPGERIFDTDVDADELAHLVSELKSIYREHTGEDFPQDPFQQLKGAIDAVFESWMAEKAVTYRRVENITGLPGTAVNVCQMVFGNMGEDSGTGVCFTRDPNTGEPTFYGDMLINAQGEDVVAGIRTPMKLSELQTLMPDVYDQLEAVRVILELHYKDMQDLEFTIERRKLYMLQCRVGKRSPAAAFRIAVDQATKGLVPAATVQRLVKKKYLPRKYAAAACKPIITTDEAILRIQAADIERLFYPIISLQIPRDELARRCLGEGIGAVPGAACGEVAFSADRAEARAKEDVKVILVRRETSPEDVGGMYVAAGILTATGGKTSHAAVVARGWGKCCIVGCEVLEINYGAKQMKLGDKVIKEGEFITIDGGTGDIYEGQIPLDSPTASPEFQTLLGWCDKRRRLAVYANADTPADARKALEFGAQGIGLCRTEHMFFDPTQPERIRDMREMIIAEDEESRRRALDKLLPFQRGDFEGMFEAMDGRPVTIRLLDPPLHEFLPQADNVEAQREIAAELNVTIERVARRVDQLEETNPMLGHRGCRLCITYPEILEMQVRAIMEAAVNCSRRGIKVHPEIMIPLTISAKELSILVERTRVVADAILKERNSNLKYSVGTMIETPRAALLADQMAEVAEFFSFGTNDLTQLTLGISRDDAGRFLPDYVESSKAGVFPHDPFQSLDVEGVGMFMRTACEKGRAARKTLKLGICGEHGGDPISLRFCNEIGLDYVSCSPLRVPIARLATAKAVIEASRVRPRKPKPKVVAKREARVTPGRPKPRKAARKTIVPKKAAPKKTAKRAGKKRVRR